MTEQAAFENSSASDGEVAESKQEPQETLKPSIVFTPNFTTPEQSDEEEESWLKEGGGEKEEDAESTSMLKRLVGWIRGAVNEIGETFQNFVKGVWEDFKSAISWVVEKVAEMAHTQNKARPMGHAMYKYM
ncbi:hypothetical protein ABW20_dc0105961 [Dactylellina cionopaga]|nr:hypothetical protein ABW20_dc0105961 [Dactylellina cionopaga]